MRRGQDDVERRRFFLGEIQPANGVDVRFNALQHPELIAASGVHLLDGAPLSGRVGHRHSAGDLESVGMIGDRRD